MSYITVYRREQSYEIPEGSTHYLPDYWESLTFFKKDGDVWKVAAFKKDGSIIWGNWKHGSNNFVELPSNDIVLLS